MDILVIEALLDVRVCECVRMLYHGVNDPKPPINSLIMKHLKAHHVLLYENSDKEVIY